MSLQSGTQRRPRTRTLAQSELTPPEVSAARERSTGQGSDIDRGVWETGAAATPVDATGPTPDWMAWSANHGAPTIGSHAKKVGRGAARECRERPTGRHNAPTIDLHAATGGAEAPRDEGEARNGGTARSMADVSDHHAGLIANHLGKRFVADMRAAATALDKAIVARDGPVRRHIVARAAVEAEL